MKFIRKVEEVEVFTYEVKAVEEFIEEVEEVEECIEEDKEVVEEVENPQRKQCLQNWSVPTLTSPEIYEFDIIHYRVWLDTIFV